MIAGKGHEQGQEIAGVVHPFDDREVARGVDPTEFTVRTAPARFRKVGDLWAPLRTGKPVDIKKLLKRKA